MTMQDALTRYDIQTDGIEGNQFFVTWREPMGTTPEIVSTHRCRETANAARRRYARADVRRANRESVF